jgi:hypothetical protein
MAETHRDDTSYERSDAPPALVGKIAAGLAATIVGAVLIVPIVFPRSASERPGQPNLTPPAPRLQDDEFRDLAALRHAEDSRLKTYGWIDRDRGVVRIPIDKAMRLVAERGVPDWPRAER